MESLRLYYPCKPYSVFQAFGQCDPQVCSLYKKMGLLGHNGEDVHCPSHTKLYAAHDGTVTYAGEDGSNGYLVVIRTDKEYEYKGSKAYFKTLYAHLEKGGIQVKAGQKIAAGHFIAFSDNTGLSTGPHLHFGLKPVYPGESDWQWYNLDQANGYNGAIDPQQYWTGIFAENVQPIVSKYTNLIRVLHQMLDYLTPKQ